MNELLADTLYSTIPYQGATDTTNTFSDSIYQSLNHVFYEDYPSIADSTLQQQKAFFTESTSQNIQLQPKTEIFFDWFFLIALLFLGCIAIIRTVAVKEIPWTFFEKRTHSLSKSVSLFSSYWAIPSTLVIIIGYLMYALLFVQIGIHVPLTFKIVMSMALAICVYLAVNWIILKCAGSLFDMKEETKTYIEKNTIFRFLLSVVLFLLAILFNYLNFMSLVKTILIVLITVFYVYKLVICIGIFKKKLVWYDIFLYFCSIEILPFVLFLKFVTSGFIDS